MRQRDLRRATEQASSFPEINAKEVTIQTEILASRFQTGDQG